MKPTEGKVQVEGVISPMIELGAGFDGDLTARENIFLNGAILGYSKKPNTNKKTAEPIQASRYTSDGALEYNSISLEAFI